MEAEFIPYEDKKEFKQAQSQYDPLSAIEKLALRKASESKGMTDAEFAKYSQLDGFSNDIGVFERVRTKTNFLTRDFVTGKWSIKPAWSLAIEKLTKKPIL